MQMTPVHRNANCVPRNATDLALWILTSVASICKSFFNISDAYIFLPFGSSFETFVNITWIPSLMKELKKKKF